MDYDVVKMLVNTLQFNYPETLKVALIVQSPMLFSACWIIIKGWLDPVTAAKVSFVNLQQLESWIDRDSIPIDLTNPSAVVSRNASQVSLNGSGSIKETTKDETPENATDSSETPP